MMSLGLSSCAKDLDPSNFPVNDVNDITIIGLSIDGGRSFAGGNIPSLWAEVGTVLTVEPLLEFALGEESSTYTYKWIRTGDHGMFPSSQPTPPGVFVVGTDRVLTLPLTGIFSETRTPFNMSFQIKDENTGLIFQRRFRIHVQDRHQSGWRILHETADNFDLTFLSNFQDTLLRLDNVLDRYESALPREGTPQALYLFHNSLAPNPRRQSDMSDYSTIIRTDKATNSVRSNDLSWEPQFDISVAFTQPAGSVLPAQFNPNRMFPSAQSATLLRTFMHYDDSWFIYTVGQIMTRFGQPINRVRVRNTPIFSEPTFKTPPFIVGDFTFGTILFDDDNKRFMQHRAMPVPIDTPSEVFMYSEPIIDLEDAIFSWHNNIERLVYMKNFTNSNGFAIIKDSQLDRYRYLRFRFSGVNIVEQLAAYTFNDNAFIESVKFFARHPTAPFLYMVTEDNRVFRAPVTGSDDIFNNRVDVTDEVLQPGYHISFFDFFNSNRIFRNFVVVGSYDPAGVAGENGRVDFFNVDIANGAFSPQITGSYIEGVGRGSRMSFTGFGRPVDIGFR
jgi:hypothetical protein